MSIISNDKLRNLCTKHSWFDEGTESQQEKLFRINENGGTVDELTTAIWMCSSQHRCDIKEVIEHQCGETMIVREEQIVEFINRKVPSDWNRMSTEERRLYMEMSYTEYNKLDNLVKRDRICALEVWCELFNSSAQTAPVQAIREINSIITRAEGWIGAENKVQRFGPYGVQRGFVRRA